MKTRQIIQKFIFLLILSFCITAVNGQVVYGRVIKGYNENIEMNNSWKTSVNDPFGVPDISEKVDIKIYPNPTRGNLNVEGVDNGTISVYNFNGQIVFQSKIENRSTRLNLDNLRAGIYTLQIKSSKGRLSKRIILQ